MLAARRDRLFGALCVVPLVPIAWALGQALGTPERTRSVDCACSSRCDELITALKNATASLADAALSRPEVARTPVAPTHGQEQSPVRESDAEMRTAIKEEINRSFSVLWRTTIDDSYGIRNAVLRSGRSPFDPDVDTAISVAWKQLSAADSQYSHDEDAIKARFHLYFQTPAGPLPDGLKQERDQQIKDYAQVHNERDAEYMKERSRIIQSLRDSLSKK